MSLADIFTTVFGEKNSALGWTIIIICLMQLIEVAPIQIHPWTYVKKKISELFISSIKDELLNIRQELSVMKDDYTAISTNVESIDDKLNTHIKESNERDVRTRRNLILRSSDEVVEGRVFDEERLAFLVNECDLYTTYCEEKGIANGVAEISIEIIKNAYREMKCKKDGDKNEL